MCCILGKTRAVSQITKDTKSLVQHKYLSPLNYIPWYFSDMDYLPLCTSSGRKLQLLYSFNRKVSSLCRIYAKEKYGETDDQGNIPLKTVGVGLCWKIWYVVLAKSISKLEWNKTFFSNRSRTPCNHGKYGEMSHTMKACFYL